MIQSTTRIHAGLVMDGNGRWATRRGLPRTVGHQAGAAALRRIVESAAQLGIGTLTLYAFSSDNWRRPLPEVTALMRLFRRYLAMETARCVDHGVAINVIGRRDRLPDSLSRAIEAAESATAHGANLLLRIAVDYSGRDALRRAALRLGGLGRAECNLEEFERLVAEVDGSRHPVPALDLVVRTGGDQRLSDFQLWESAYAELFFRPELWPDFRPEDLAQVIGEFRARSRRFGGLDQPARLELARQGEGMR